MTLELLFDRLRADAGALPLETVTYAEAVAAAVPVPALGASLPSPEELAAAGDALIARDLLTTSGEPQGPLRDFAALFARPGARTWWWEAAQGTTLIVLVAGRDAAGIATPVDGGVRYDLGVRTVGGLVEAILEDAWSAPTTRLTALNLAGLPIDIRLEQGAHSRTVTAPRHPEAPMTAAGLRTAVPAVTHDVDRSAFARLLAAAFGNVTWGLDEAGRELFRSLAGGRT